MVIFSFSPYLLRIVSDEKENRTMELMMTMVSPEAMIYGKLLGLTAVFGTQMVVWGGLFVVVALGSLVALQVVPYTFLLLVLLFGVPTFMMLVAIMTAIGSVTANLEQGQQMAGPPNWVFTFPLFFVLIALVDPNNPLMVGLTFFPLTAFAAVIMRWAMGATPLWQVVVSWLLVVMTAVWMMLLAVRVFRVGMLEYGQRLGWSTIWRVVRGGEK
jgi:ABC-2 type transport system permease protein